MSNVYLFMCRLQVKQREHHFEEMSNNIGKAFSTVGRNNFYLILCTSGTFYLIL